jgi:hypothetical protein
MAIIFSQKSAFIGFLSCDSRYVPPRKDSSEAQFCAK